MKTSEIEQILARHAAGEISLKQATESIKNLSYENIGYARVDHARAARQGFPEVVFGAGKTRSQILGRLQKFNGVPPKTFYLHLKECEYRFNHRNENLQLLLLKLLERFPL